MAYGFRDDAYFILKINGAFQGELHLIRDEHKNCGVVNGSDPRPPSRKPEDPVVGEDWKRFRREGGKSE